MQLPELGLTPDLANYIKDNIPAEFVAGRVTQEHRERYIVSTGDREYEAEITGNLRFSAVSRAEFPAVGDWVAMIPYDNELAIIHQVLPRRSVLERQAVGKTGEKQIIAANVDLAFIMQSVDNNFNLNRLERYLSICYTSDIVPVIVISKTDLATREELEQMIRELETREKNIRYILLSNLTGDGLDQLAGVIEKGKTCCVVGSSGVGKSTLINTLLGMEVLRTREISHSTGKGKHATEHRELFVLENGGILIDTPGMRELGVTESAGGIQSTFREIVELSLKCRFSDCRHVSEKGCAVLEAVQQGIIDRASLENYRKMLREQEHFQSTIAERRKKEKDFGKMVREVIKEKKKNKY